MINALRSESLLLRRRPALYVIGGLWLLMVVAFAYGIPYIVFRTVTTSQQDRQALLEVLTPDHAGLTSLSSYPLFGGALMLVLGVLLTGSEYRWGTWKVRLVQGPRRHEVLLAKMLTGASGLAVLAAATLLLSLLVSTVIAEVSSAPLAWPSPADLARSLAAALLISVAWMSVGAVLAVAFRGTSVALAAGLLWTLLFENVLSGLATVFSALEPLRTVLLGSASGSLVGAMGAKTQSNGGTPGVVDHLSGPWSVLVLTVYIVGSAAAAAVLLRRRDVV